MAIQTTRYQIVKGPGKWDFALGYFDFDEKTERERLISLTVSEEDQTYELPVYIDHIKRSGFVDGHMLDQRRDEQYFEGYCRGLPFRGDAGNDYPIRGVVSLVNRQGWLEITLSTRSPHD